MRPVPSLCALGALDTKLTFELILHLQDFVGKPVLLTPTLTLMVSFYLILHRPSDEKCCVLILWTFGF